MASLAPLSRRSRVSALTKAAVGKVWPLVGPPISTPASGPGPGTSRSRQPSAALASLAGVTWCRAVTTFMTFGPVTASCFMAMTRSNPSGRASGSWTWTVRVRPAVAFRMAIESATVRRPQLIRRSGQGGAGRSRAGSSRAKGLGVNATGSRFHGNRKPTTSSRGSSVSRSARPSAWLRKPASPVVMTQQLGEIMSEDRSKRRT
jgi:hypothetical protein